MKEMQTFNRLSRKIAFIVGPVVVIIAAPIAVYMQIRILFWADRHGNETLQIKLYNAADESNRTFTDAIYNVRSMRNFAESTFIAEEYINDAENYFDTSVKPVADTFISNIVSGSDFIDGAYFAVQPHLTGRPYVGEVYFVNAADGVVRGDSEPYENFLDEETMEWFYGAFNSGLPYWTQVYEDEESGVLMGATK